MRICVKVKKNRSPRAFFSDADPSEGIVELEKMNLELENIKRTEGAPYTKAKNESHGAPEWLLPVMLAQGAPKECYLFHRFFDAVGSMFLSSAQIRVQQTILECLDYLPARLVAPDSARDEADSRHDVLSTIADLVCDVQAAFSVGMIFAEDPSTPCTGRILSTIPGLGVAVEVSRIVQEFDPSRTATWRWTGLLSVTLRSFMGRAPGFDLSS